MLRPLGAAVAVFVFAITGFVSVANASGRALPGDELYPVKLSIEKVQLALAFGADSRANLQVEFAGRRLEEMVTLAATSQESAPESVELAVERFKSEVTTIKEALQEETGVQEKKELAKALGRQAQVYSSAVSSSTNDLAPDVRVEVQEIIAETQEQAVEVIITAHEQSRDADTEHELALALEIEIKQVSSTFGEQSGAAIEAALALQAEGNYRRAFQVLKEFVTLSSREVSDEGSP
jgi:phage protein D